LEEPTPWQSQQVVATNSVKSASVFSLRSSTAQSRSGYIHAYMAEFGVVPICKVLQVAPSTYSTAKSRPLLVQALSDERLDKEIQRP